MQTMRTLWRNMAWHLKSDDAVRLTDRYKFQTLMVDKNGDTELR